MMEKSPRKKAVEFCIKELCNGNEKIELLKKTASSKFKCDVVKNSEILKSFPKNKLTEKIKKLLFRKPVRTISGVSPIAVMVKPLGSCRFNCIYCPAIGKAAKSYTGEEPAALRARRENFDPFKQVKARLMHYKIQGHNSDKCELIVMGGTFLDMDEEYKKNFILKIYEALNEKKSKSIESAKKLNETAKHRVVGLTIETRPDICKKKEINEALQFGATKFELGVQHPDDKIYEKIKRGHIVKDVENATALLKDSCFKVLYHLMPGLPGSNAKKDIEMFKKVFSNEMLKPDMLKIYPTLVVENSGIYELYKKGKYNPYDAETCAEIIANAYRYIPKYARVMRIQRDIPANKIIKGNLKGNLRELVEKKAKELGIEINEIRFNEAGRKEKKYSRKNAEIERIDYKASLGKEIFLSMQDKNENCIYGFLRLRIPGKNIFREEISEKTALVRELHVYGSETEIGKPGAVQHRGIGTELLKTAEEIAKKEFGMEKCIVISGAGARKFYYKTGYELKGPYVSKKL